MSYGSRRIPKRPVPARLLERIEQVFTRPANSEHDASVGQFRMRIWAFARIGAVAGLRRADFFDAGDQYCLRFLDKGGKSREIPVRHDLQGFLFAYLDAATLRTAPADSPMFRSVVRRTRMLTANGMTAGDLGRMIRRRMRDANLPSRLSAHSFRVTTVTDLLTQGVPLEDVQQLAGHSDPRTTRLYDRRQRRITRNIVERISV